MKECSKCNQTKPLTEFYKGKKYKDGYRGQCKQCMTKYERKPQYYLESQRKSREQRYRQTINHKLNKRLMVLHHYGGTPPKCTCCGETIIEFLTIDHINEDGAKHRRKLKSNIENWLIKNDYPDGFQILCRNCNWGKHYNGECPHKTSIALPQTTLSLRYKINNKL